MQGMPLDKHVFQFLTGQAVGGQFLRCVNLRFQRCFQRDDAIPSLLKRGLALLNARRELAGCFGSVCRARGGVKGLGKGVNGV